MGIIFDDTVSDSGIALLGEPATVNYVLWQITATGDFVRPAEFWDTERLMRVGYFQFSYRGVDFGDELDFWDAPRWFDNREGRWLPGPLTPPATTVRWFAAYLRWCLSPGSTVRLQVND